LGLRARYAYQTANASGPSSDHAEHPEGQPFARERGHADDAVAAWEWWTREGLAAEASWNGSLNIDLFLYVKNPQI
jgi:hypothetical protein